jgi:hypothetical protein
MQYWFFSENTYTPNVGITGGYAASVWMPLFA